MNPHPLISIFIISVLQGHMDTMAHFIVLANS